jgi:plasmid stability protein
MVSITLKDIPRDLHRTLKQRALLHHRSLNKEILATIEQALCGVVTHQDVQLGTGKGLMAHRLSDDSLINIDFGDEWEMDR